MSKIKILIADDHKMIRDGIQAMLDGKEHIEVVAEATNGKEAVQICSEQEIDVAILDITMPEMDGIEATKEISEKCPEVAVLALTMLDEDEYIRMMVKAGALGYILKSSGSEELEKAIRSVAQGEHYFSEEAKETIMKDLVESKGKRKASEHDLTDREIDVLKLICQELTNQEIADKLHISVRTVDAHRRNLLQKTGARNTAGLVKFGITHNICS